MISNTSEHYCHICGAKITPQNRVKSHILTKSTYYVKGIEYAISSDNHIFDAKKRATEQDLLCNHCDHKIGQWEQKRLEFFTSDGSRPSKPQNAQSVIFEYNFDNEQIVLACLADIYRCSISNLEPYSSIHLGNRHEHRIQKILLAGTISDFTEYPVILGRYSDEEKILDDLTQIPHKLRFQPGGTIYYRTFLPGGWSWMVRISKQSFPTIDYGAIPKKGGIPVLNLGNSRYSPLFRAALRKALILEKAGY